MAPPLSMSGESLDTKPQRIYVSTMDQLRDFLPLIFFIPASDFERPGLACGTKSYNDELCILTIHLRESNKVYIFNLKALGPRVFVEEAADGNSLAKLLSRPYYTQVWWDLRKDAQLLLDQYGVYPGSVVDAQLEELVCRAEDHDRTNLRSLETAMLRQSFASDEERTQWFEIKQRMNKDYSVFEQFGLPEYALDYAAGDVTQLLKWHDGTWPLLNEEDKELVLSESAARKLGGSGLDAPPEFQERYQRRRREEALAEYWHDYQDGRY